MDELDQYPVAAKDELDAYPPPVTQEGSTGKAQAGGGFLEGLKEVGRGALDTVKGIGHGIMSANEGAAQVIQHPIDTLGNRQFRTEAMRGVNDTIMPVVGNKLVEAVGGAPENSTEDTKAFPNARALGGAAGMAVPLPIGEVASLAAKPVRSFVKGAAERQIERGAEALGEGATKKARTGLVKSVDEVRNALAEHPDLLKNAGKGDEKLAPVAEKIASDAGARLKNIYKSADELHSPAGNAILEKGVPPHAPVANLNARISELKTGDVGDRKVAKALEGIRDEFESAYNGGKAIPASKLREEQSAYQRMGYAKSMDPDANITIQANREAQKAVGEALVQHVTGMSYSDAAKAAVADPKSIAGQLFKANDDVMVANRIKAAIESRAGSNPGAPHRLTSLVHGLRHGVAGTAAGALLGTGHGHMAIAPLAIDAALTAAPKVGKAIDNATVGLANSGVGRAAGRAMTAVEKIRTTNPIGGTISGARKIGDMLGKASAKSGVHKDVIVAQARLAADLGAASRHVSERRAVDEARDLAKDAFDKRLSQSERYAATKAAFAKLGKLGNEDVGI